MKITKKKEDLIPLCTSSLFVIMLTAEYFINSLPLAILTAALIYILSEIVTAILQRKLLGRKPEIINTLQMLPRMDTKGKALNILSLVLPLIIWILSGILIYKLFN